MRHDGGLTLLELLLVVFILSVAALSAVSLVDRTDQQVRFEDTQGRLRQIRRGILGPEDPADGPRLLWGYVADLGALPGDIESLVRLPAGMDTFGSRAARFDPDGSVSGDEVDLDLLAKGWRGPYVTLPPSTDPTTARFRDGWGNLSAVDDDLHHGWNDLDPTANPFEIVSPGADGLAGGTGDYDADAAVSIGSDDWQVALAGWSIDVKNSSGGQVDLRVSVLVYAGGSWTRRNSAQAAVADGATGTFAFASGATVPLGRHLVVVVADSDATEGNGETPYNHPGGPYVTKRVDFWPRTHPATFTLEVR
ncbi:MAG: prepilin-type N-terminal cleavage/methylation domain-containing protein [Planctomycetota bacterium]|jgi:prepilin-type N-terminal cleavage/methylation domain-containing protein